MSPLPTFDTSTIIDGNPGRRTEPTACFSDIKTVVNAMDDDNLKDGGVIERNIEDLSVLATKIDGDAVDTRALADEAITNGKLDHWSNTQAVGAGSSALFNHNLGTTYGNGLQPLVSLALQAGATPSAGDPLRWEVEDLDNIRVYNDDTVPHNVTAVVI